MKKFFGSIFIGQEELEEAGIRYPIRLEYYKQINETNSNAKARYGINIIKTEYQKDKTKVENKYIKYITNDESTANKILDILKSNQVTPINFEEILTDLFRKRVNDF